MIESMKFYLKKLEKAEDRKTKNSVFKNQEKFSK